MKKSFILFLLALLTLAPMAWAQTIVSTEAQLRNAIAIDGANIQISRTIILAKHLAIEPGYTITIDLNGHTLKRNLTSATDLGCVIIVTQTGNLTLEGGTVSGGWNSSTTGNTAGGIVNKGTLTLNNVTIDNCKGIDGGAIMNVDDATLAITGGTISNCQSTAHGGGAIVNYGTATLSGCTMSGNTAYSRGGAIWNNGSLTVSGCTFSGNNATNNDGGALHLESGTATLTDVTVTNNTSKDAGGIYVHSAATLNLGGATGSTLSGNTSSAHGGGGIVNYGTAALNGTVSVTGNTCHTDGGGIWNNGTLRMQGDIQVKDNTGDDIYMKSGKLIDVTGALTGGQNSIGIRMESLRGVFTTHYGASGTSAMPFFPSGTINTISVADGECRQDISYYECSWNGYEGSWEFDNINVLYTVKTIPASQAVANLCTLIDPDHGGFLNGNAYWFIVDGTLDLQDSHSSVTCAEGTEVHLILCDNSSFKTDGFYVNAGSTLHIYCQSYGDKMGKLVSENSRESQPGIGPEHDGSYAGVIDIHGGDITAKGGQYAAGIGGCEDRSSGTITIYDGKINSVGGENGAGIGGGEGGSGTVTKIHGGTIYAQGGVEAAGIGGGEKNDGGGDSGLVEIHGGDITAVGGGEKNNSNDQLGGAGIGGGKNGPQTGPIIILGGKITAWGAHNSAGIGGGSGGSGGTIEIHGGIVTAWGDQLGAGIGSGAGCHTEDGPVDGGHITIDGGVVMAYTRHKDMSISSATEGAAIGGGWCCNGGTIIINGGVVIANSEDGAAIGGGGRGSRKAELAGNGGNIIISDGSVVAMAHQGGAGIGGGARYKYASSGGEGGNITISGGEVVAVGGGEKLTFVSNHELLLILLKTMGDGPVSSNKAEVANIIADGLTQLFAHWMSTDEFGGAGIGGGWMASGGTINITGGTVVACSGHGTDDDGKKAEAIGHGYLNDDSGTLSLNYANAMVTAGSDENHATIKLVNDRKNACRSRYARIEPCGHKNATVYTDNGDGTYNTLDCPNCAMPNPQSANHTYIAPGNWNDADHWNSGHVPGAGNSVILHSDCTIPEGYTAVAGNIDIPVLDTLTIADGGQLVHSGSGVIATVEKNITAYSGDGGYCLLTNPVADRQNPDSLGMTKDDYDLYWFDQSEDLEWRNYKQIPFILNNGKGYLYANSNDTIVAFRGMLNRANFDFSVPVTYDANAYFAGWNLIGNPFVCDAYLADGRDFYVLDSDGDEVVLSATNSIAPLQGLFVQTETNENAISFTTTAPGQGRALNMSVMHGRGASTGSATTVIDKARIRFGEGRNLEKFQLNPSHSKLYIPQEGKDYAVLHSEAKGELPINFTAKENGTYTLSLSSENMTFSYLHLIDNLTGADVDLLAAGPSTGSGTGYTFNAKTTDYASRFKLVFSANDALTVSASDETFAFISNGNIIVNGEGTLQVIDITGHVVLSDSGHTRCVPTSGMPAGVYVLRLINGDDIKVQKIVIQ